MSASERLRRESFFILLLLFIIFLVYFCILGQGGYRKLQQQRQQMEILRLENTRLRAENDALMKNIRGLKTDAGVIERIAREDYNFARPGDIIVNLAEK
ncbi:MAG TPA: septum formation initiator family protein [Acidobacteriota bacterium]|jgi:cell division protein FtsB